MTDNLVAGEGPSALPDLDTIDYVFLAGSVNSDFDALSKALDCMSDAMKEWTSEAQSHSVKVARFNNSPESKSPQAGKTARRLVGAVARDLDAFAKNIEKELPIVRTRYSEAVRNYIQLCNWEQTEEMECGHRQHVDKVDGIRKNMSKCRTSVEELRDSIALFPSLTPLFNRSKKRLVKAIGNLVEWLDDGIVESVNLVQYVTPRSGTSPPK